MNLPVQRGAELDHLQRETDLVLHAVVTDYRGRTRDEALADVWLQMREQHPGRIIIVHHRDENPNFEWVPAEVAA
jgi:hypothetical protein